MSTTQGRVESANTYNITPVACSWRGMDIHMGPFPLCGAMASSPATNAPKTQASANFLLHLASSQATFSLVYRCISRNLRRLMIVLGRGSYATASGSQMSLMRNS